MTTMDFLTGLIRVSVQGAFLTLVVMGIQRGLRRWLTARGRAALWGLVLIRLLLPIGPQTSWSLFNWVTVTDWSRTVTAPVAVAKSERSKDPFVSDPKDVSVGRLSSAMVANLETERRGEKPVLGVPPHALEPLDKSTKQKRERVETAGIGWAESTSGVRNRGWVFGFGFWLAGALVLLTRMAWNTAHFHRRVRLSESDPGPGARELLERCKHEMRVSSAVRLVETDAIQGPMLMGVWRPCLLLPKGFSGEVSELEQRMVYLHELSHLKRWDIAMNWLVAALQMVHWFNPVLWMGFARHRRDRELACDELALCVAGRDSAECYGRTLLKLLQSASRVPVIPPVAGISEEYRWVKERIEWISDFGFRPMALWPGVAVWGAVALLTLTDAKGREDSGRLETGSQAPRREAAGAPPAIEERRIQVLAIDDESGRPLEGVELEWTFTLKLGRGDSDGRIQRLGESDGDGIWVTTVSAEGIVQGELRARLDAYGPLRMIWKRAGATILSDRVELRFRKGKQIGGVLLGPEGRPISGGRVKVARHWRTLEERNVEGIHSDFPGETVSTDSEGRWKIGGVPEDLLSQLRIHASHPEFLASTTTPGDADTTGVAELREHRHVIRMAKGLVLTGRVMDESGAPVAQARVWFGRASFRNRAEVESGENGEFTFRSLDPKAGDVGFATEPVSVLAPGYQPATTNVAMGGPFSSLVFRLAKAVTLRGRVVDLRGKPIPNAEIILENRTADDAGIPWDFRTNTDADGRFEWDSAPGRPMPFTIFAPGFQALRNVPIPSDWSRITGMETQVKMAPVRRVKGRVISEGDARAVKTFSIVPGAGDERRLMSWSPSDKAEFYDEEGRFELVLDEAGHTAIRIDAEGHESRVIRLVSIGAASTELRVELKAVPSAVGQLIGTDGRPAARVDIFSWPADQPGAVSYRRFGLALESAFDGMRVRTDSDGNFRLPSYGNRSAWIAAKTEDGFVQVALTNLSRSPRLELKSYGSVEGQLLDGDRPLAGIQMSMQLNDSLGFWGVDGSLSATTGEDGRFRLDQVPAGRHRLMRVVRAGVYRKEMSHLVWVEVIPGKTSRVEQPKSVATRAVKGAVRIKQTIQSTPEVVLHGELRSIQPTPPGTLRSDAEVRAWMDSPAYRELMKETKEYHFELSREGNFRVDSVAAGKYRLTVSAVTRDPTRDFQDKVLAQDSKEVEVPRDLGARADVDAGLLRLE